MGCWFPTLTLNQGHLGSIPDWGASIPLLLVEFNGRMDLLKNYLINQQRKLWLFGVLGLHASLKNWRMGFDSPGSYETERSMEVLQMGLFGAGTFLQHNPAGRRAVVDFF